MARLGPATGLKVNLWLEHKALGGLRVMAPLIGCKTRRMAEILTRLPDDPTLYRDARPMEWRTHDLPLVEAGDWPLWGELHPRAHIAVPMHRPTFDKLLRIAEYHHITCIHSHRADKCLPATRVSATVNAIGLRLLTFSLTHESPV